MAVILKKLFFCLGCLVFFKYGEEHLSSFLAEEGMFSSGGNKKPEC